MFGFCLKTSNPNILIIAFVMPIMGLRSVTAPGDIDHHPGCNLSEKPRTPWENPK
jgi:hypothetical protein